MATLLMLLAVCSMAAPDQTARSAGYDPKRDPSKDLEVAVEQAQKQHKRILLVVGGEWCGWCHTLDNYVKNNPDVQSAWAASYITIKVNWSPENRNETFLSRYPPIRGYPHIFVLEKDGRFLHSQDTVLLEIGSTYAKEAMMDFLHRWQPRRDADDR
jgi:thioredoxin-related protein